MIMDESTKCQRRHHVTSHCPRSVAVTPKRCALKMDSSQVRLRRDGWQGWLDQWDFFRRQDRSDGNDDCSLLLRRRRPRKVILRMSIGSSCQGDRSLPSKSSSSYCFSPPFITSSYSYSSSSWASRWIFLACSCFYLLSSASSESSVAATDGSEKKKSFLRSGVAAAAAADVPAGSDSLSNAVRSESDNSSFDEGGYSVKSDDVSIGTSLLEPSQDTSGENDDDEVIFDYETYHAQHNIPVPALSTSLMGSMVTEQKEYLDDYDLDHHKGFFAFAGTNAAMKQFATDEAVSERTGHSLQSKPAGKIKSNLSMGTKDNPSKAQSPPSPYEATLASISRSRSSLLWGSAAESMQEGEDDNELSIPGQTDNHIMGDGLNLLSIQKDTISSSLEHSSNNLDRGRHLVGLDVREVQSHQQIIVDYGASTLDFSGNMNSQYQQIRVKYIPADDTESDVEIYEQDQVMLTLLETSFSIAADTWSKALSLPPVMDRIVPTVEKCGGSKVPKYHREKGVEGADIIIYVSGDNRYCGGAIMHAAVCDFDQNMRPIVGNINICTINMPLDALPDGRPWIKSSVLDEYASYVTVETGRILGASASLFRYFINPDTLTPYGVTEKSVACVDGTREKIEVPGFIFEDSSPSGQRYYEIRSPKVVEIVRNHFDCMTMTGARLEQAKGSISCLGGFLDDRLFFGEQGSAWQVAKTQGTSISPLTLALLEDSTWYLANYEVSTEIPFGRGAGCQFARGGCVPESVEEVPSYSSGFFCSELEQLGCDPSHSYKAKCGFPSFLSSPNNSEQCPMFIRDAINCSENTDPFSIRGEFYGESSKCFLTNQGEPMCLRGICNEESQTIDVHYEDEVFSCRRDGDIINTKKGLRIECPRISAVCPSLSCPSNCSGKGVCDEDSEGKHTCICDDPFDNTAGCWGGK